MNFPSRDPTVPLALVHPSARSSLLGSLVWIAILCAIGWFGWSAITKVFTPLQAWLFLGWMAAWIVLPRRLALASAVLRPHREGIDVYRGVTRVGRLSLDSIRQIEVTAPRWVSTGRHSFLRCGVLLWVGPKAYVAASNLDPDEAAELGRWIYPLLPHAELAIISAEGQASTLVVATRPNAAAPESGQVEIVLAAPRQRTRLLWFGMSSAWVVGIGLLEPKTHLFAYIFGAALMIHVGIWFLRYRRVVMSPAARATLIRRCVWGQRTIPFSAIQAVEVTVPQPTPILGWPPKELLSNAVVVAGDERHPIAIRVPQHEAASMAVTMLKHLPSAELRLIRSSNDPDEE